MKKSIFTFLSYILLNFFNVASAQACFLPAINFTVGLYPESVVSADFNNDGKMDLAVSISNKVSIKLGNGLGGFSATTNFTIGLYPSSLTAGDYNGDGNIDLATGSDNTNYNYVSVSLGNGTGNFAAFTNFPVGFISNSIINGDFNGDGKLDIATANRLSSNISILIGNGLGSFTVGTFTIGSEPFSITSADFNGDGKKDLATANTSSNSISILFGNGIGSFSVSSNIAFPSFPTSLTAGDFNSDGKMDLAVSTAISASSPTTIPITTGQNDVSILLGDGFGNFSTNSYTVGQVYSINSIISNDFNNDGNLDLAIANNNMGNVSVLIGNGAGSFPVAVDFPLIGSPISLTSADFNSDGKLDIATANSNSNAASLSVLLSYFDFTFIQTNTTCHGSANGSAAAVISCGVPPYNYSWNTIPTQTTSMVSGLTEGYYEVTVTDFNNVPITHGVYISQPQLLELFDVQDPQFANTKCSGTCNGTGALSVNGGIPPYTYQWDGSANNQITDLAYSLCPGFYGVTVKDSNNCTVQGNAHVVSATIANPDIYLTNLAAVDQANVSPAFSAYYSYSLPTTITPNPSNPRNFVDPGKKARFKVECTNHKGNGQSIVSGICKVRSNNPYITITDSSSALNNIGWNGIKWSADEFEININPNTPQGTNAYIDFVVQEMGFDYVTTCIAIPITPLVYSQTNIATIDDDNNPDSNGNDNDICDPQETIEFFPMLDNVSQLDAEYVRGRFENLDNHSFINIWNGIPGVNTTVYDATWWNYAFGQPQTINPFSIYTTPEYDFVFDYNNTSVVNNFKLYLVMAGGFKLFSGSALSLVQWSLPYTFNNTNVISVNELNAENLSIIIHPNPTSEIVNIKSDSVLKDINIKLFNAQGQIIFESNQFISEIDLSDKPKGIYFIQIKSNGKAVNKKVIVQ